MKRLLLTLLFSITFLLRSLADEGMWLYSAPPREQVKTKYGFDLTDAWLEHLQKKYTRKKAESFLRTWAKEDVYFTLDRELELLKDAGFTNEVTFRKDSFAVVVGLK